MPTRCPCLICQEELEPAQALRFFVEMQNVDNPDYLARIRRLPSIEGLPLQICHSCQTTGVRIGKAKPKPKPASSPSVVVALGLASFGLFVVNLLTGPRG